MLTYEKQLGEKLLFHGTITNDPSVIYKGNTFSCLWRKGNYFSVNASYSNGFAYVCGSYRQILVVFVLTGMSYHNEADCNFSELCIAADYDSVSCDIGGSRVYVTHESVKVYPAYLITYKQ